jgi:fatty acid desaturase
MSREEFPFDNTQIPETPQLYIRRDEDRMMQGKTWRRLGIALWILGFIILVANGVAVIGNYLAGWSISSLPSVAIGVVFLVIGWTTANKKRQI